MKKILKKIVAISMAILLIPLSNIVMATKVEETYTGNYHMSERDINNNQIAGLAVFEALYSQFPSGRCY